MKPDAVQDAPPAVETPAAPEAPSTSADSEAVFEAVAEPIIEPTVEAEPLRPKARPVPAVEIIVEPEAAEQIDTVPPPLSTEQAGAADPRAIPSVVVTPTLYATVGAVIEKVKTNDAWRIAAVIGALVVTAGFIWLATLPSGDAPPLDMDAPPPAAPGLTTPVADEGAPAGPAEASPQTGSAPPLTETATALRPALPAATARTVGPAATTAPAPRIVVPSVDTPVAAPVIETGPPALQPPTAAAPAPTDPDAPIQTRPQPLN